MNSGDSGMTATTSSFMGRKVRDAYHLSSERVTHMLGRGAVDVVRARVRAAALNGCPETEARPRSLAGAIVCGLSSLTVRELVEACEITGTRLDASPDGFVWRGRDED